MYTTMCAIHKNNNIIDLLSTRLSTYADMYVDVEFVSNGEIFKL